MSASAILRIWTWMMREPFGWGAGKVDSCGDVVGFEHIRLRHTRLSATLADREFRLDSARINRPDLDPVRAKLLVEPLRKTNLREFRGAIDGLAREAINTGHGRDHQNKPLALLNHDRRDMAGEQECRADVHVHHLDIIVDRREVSTRRAPSRASALALA